MEFEETSNGNIVVFRGRVHRSNYFNLSMHMLRTILVDLNQKQEKAKKIYYDNKSII